MRKNFVNCGRRMQIVWLTDWYVEEKFVSANVTFVYVKVAENSCLS